MIHSESEVLQLEAEIEQLRPLGAFYAAECGENKRLKQLIGELADALNALIRFNRSNCQKEVDLIKRAREAIK